MNASYSTSCAGASTTQPYMSDAITSKVDLTTHGNTQVTYISDAITSKADLTTHGNTQVTLIYYLL